MRLAGHVARMGDKRNTYRGFLKCRKENPFLRPSCREADDIKMDLKEVGGGSMDWIDLAQERDMRY